MRTLVLTMIVAMVVGLSTAPARAGDEAEPRKGSVVGKFVRLFETSVEGRSTPAMLIDTGEDGEQTVVVSRFQAKLLGRVRELKGGEKVAVSYVRELGYLWAGEMEVIHSGDDAGGGKADDEMPTGVAELQRRVRALTAEVERLRLENEKLRKELDLLRGGDKTPGPVAEKDKDKDDWEDLLDDEPEQKGVDPLTEPITARGNLRANVQKYTGATIKGERYVGIVVREDGATESVTVYVPRQVNEEGKSETLPSVKAHAEKLTPGKYARIDWVEQAGVKWLRSAVIIDRGGWKWRKR